MPAYLCPVCSAPLSRHSKQWKCAANHCYDEAREGYVNLLLANQKKSRDPGDSAEMLVARRAFLEMGFYRFMPEKAVSMIQTHVAPGQTEQEALDIGCGEGYYTALFAAQLNQWRWQGIDISKAGVRMAAKKYPDIAFAVASNFQLPLAEGSQSVITQIFAPASVDEVCRVLADDGLYLTVNPAAKHLWALKQRLYDEPQEHETHLLKNDHLDVVAEEICTAEVLIESKEVLQQLFSMTPFFWNVGKERQEQLEQLDRLQSTLSFHMALYQRKPRQDEFTRRPL